jgi:hypothetical protein
MRLVSKASKVNTTVTERRCAQNIHTETYVKHALLQECVLCARDIYCLNYGRPIPWTESLKRERWLIQNVMKTCGRTIKIRITHEDNRGGTYRLHLPGRRLCQSSNQKETGSKWIAPCFLLGLLSDPEDGSNTLLRNVCVFLQNYTTLQPRRSFSSLSPV